MLSDHLTICIVDLALRPWKKECQIARLQCVKTKIQQNDKQGDAISPSSEVEGREKKICSETFSGAENQWEVAK